MTPGRIVAVIDVGSNSVRLLVGRDLGGAAFEVIDEERFDARLGEEQAADGTLPPAAIERGVQALRLVHQVALAHAPEAVVAAGTEALRRAPNAGVLCDRVMAESGLQIRVLSAREEAFASFLGVVNSTTLVDGRIIDIGGGSLEVIEVRDRQFSAAASAPLGAIYATSRFLHTDPPNKKELRTLRKAVRDELPVHGGAGVLVGVGGAMRNLARIARLRRRYPLRRLHGLELSRAEVRRIARDLSVVGAAERRRIPGVASARGDILHAAALVVDEAMEASGAAKLIISGQGLREGLLWQEIRGGSPVLPDVRAASISGLARANQVDEMAAEPAVMAAALLFDATRPVHGFGAMELDLLVDAARLAGIGLHVDFYGRDRHAEYVVHSGDLHGFEHREIVLLGALVRAADGGNADLTPYRTLLQPDDARRVSVLGALLGLARAVRRRQPSPVTMVRAALSGQVLDLQLSGDGPFDAEVVSLERQARRIESALGLQLTVSVR